MKNDTLFLCKLISEGPKDNNLSEYVYLLKAKNKKAKIEFKTILKGICYHIPERDRHSLEEASGFMELIQIIKDQKIRSIGEIQRQKEIKKSNLSAITKKQNVSTNKPNITRESTHGKTNVQCFTCGGPHYSSQCPNKKMKVNNDESKEKKSLMSLELCFIGDIGREPSGIIGNIENKDVFMLVDTGATNCFMDLKLAQVLNLKVLTCENEELKLAKGVSKILGKVNVNMDLSIKRIVQEFYLVDGLSHSLILGSDFIANNKVKLDISAREVDISGLVMTLISEYQLIRANEEVKITKNKHHNLEVYTESTGKIAASRIGLLCMNQFLLKGKNKLVCYTKTENFKIYKDEVVGILQSGHIEYDPTKELSLLGFENCEDSTLAKVLTEYEFELKRNAKYKNLAPHTIVLKDNYKVVNRRNFKASMKDKDVILEEVHRLLKEDKIQESNSLWNSPIILVPKPNGSYRMCIDYRSLNDLTVPELCPPPSVEESLNSLSGSSVFTTLDLNSGYHQVPLNPESYSLLLSLLLLVSLNTNAYHSV